MLGSLITGCDVFVMRSVITPESYIAAVLITRPYILPIVPQFAQLLLLDKQQHLCDSIKEFLEYCVIAGAGISDEIINQLIRKNLPITTGYGLTEAPIVSSISPQNYKIGSVGKLQRQLESCIEPNGEIVIRGDILMLGYYKDPEATACKIDADGWLHTGDKGHLDEEGYLYVEGRLEQDMIVLPNGENIHPEDIESKINAIPNVKESIVVSRNGKLVAIVVPTNSNLSQQDILNVVNPQLPLYSQLYDIELLEKPLERTEKQTLKRYLYTKKTNF
jgi:long-chain acyl-CoA synthetase